MHGRRHAHAGAAALLAAVVATVTVTGNASGPRAEHPRAMAAEGRQTHPRISPDLWPPDPLAPMPSRILDEVEPRGPVRVEVLLERSRPALIERIGRYADRMLHVSGRHRRVSVEVADRSRLLAIADLDGVVAVERQWEPVRHAGSVTSRAVQALNVERVATMGPMLDGMGQKLGILSDSFARTDAIRTGQTRPGPCPATESGPATVTGLANQESGDLPQAVELWADDAHAAACPEAGGLVDEGAAMAELAYDLAPAIDIAFHTAFISPASFAEGFDRLCAPGSEGGAGATVVVDDVIWPTAEPMYQPGIIARAATACVDAGVTVLSAAGNSAGNGFREQYVDADPVNAGGFGEDFHDWGDGTGLVPVELPEGASFRAVLQWNQPWLSLAPEGEPRGPRIDLDLYLLNGDDPASAAVVARSVRDQQADHAGRGLDPWEIIGHAGLEAGTYFLAVDHAAGSKTTIPQDDDTPLEFRLVFFGAQGAVIGGAASPPGPGGPTLYGHAGATGVIAVGAVPWWTTPAFDPTADDSPTDGIDPQVFTAVGGALPAHFDGQSRFSGRRLPWKPQIAAVDGNNNTFFGFAPPTEQDGEPDAHPNFFGTSAAAPNAAAVGMLLRQFADDLSPAALERALVDTAVDVDGERAGPGPDAVSGAGLIDAEAMLDRFPVAVAGRDDNVIRGHEVTLDGTDSSGGKLGLETFAWSQLAGPDVVLDGADGPRATFIAPDDVGADLVFTLAVTDDRGASDNDRIRLTVVEPFADTATAGSGSTGGGGGGCFIATAAHGSALAPEVSHLRSLRDDYLARTYTGRLLIRSYNRWSPPLADAIRGKPRVRAAVRAALVPLVLAAAHPLATAAAVLIVVIGLAGRRRRRRGA